MVNNRPPDSSIFVLMYILFFLKKIKKKKKKKKIDKKDQLSQQISRPKKHGQHAANNVAQFQKYAHSVSISHIQKKIKGTKYKQYTYKTKQQYSFRLPTTYSLCTIKPRGDKLYGEIHRHRISWQQIACSTIPQIPILISHQM